MNNDCLQTRVLQILLIWFCDIENKQVMWLHIIVFDDVKICLTNNKNCENQIFCANNTIYIDDSINCLFQTQRNENAMLIDKFHK